MGCAVSCRSNHELITKENGKKRKTCLEKNELCSAENVLTPVQIKNEVRYFKFPLSKKEVEALKNSWDHVKSRWFELLKVVFRRWFTTHPTVRKLFKNLPANSSFEELLVSKELVIHVQRIESAVDIVISKVDKIEDLILLLIELGRLHYELGVNQSHANALAASFQFGICEVFQVKNLLTYMSMTLFHN
ncbi:uncharacterized protein LOC105851027 isoform X2 [Hydra vulgaris]|uniref:uncharacterized protein LOC105851027 isoform X2 n=1 Tax=Hydra vulgaris TaxID=6087 RepID=UPI001F5F97B9|nr:uncharacterized protein LOC105851027 isoform X2 [Hydra vulgaris]